MEQTTPVVPGPPPPSRRAPSRGAGQRSVWAVFGTILAVLLVTAGLVTAGLFVAVFIALASFGSNK